MGDNVVVTLFGEFGRFIVTWFVCESGSPMAKDRLRNAYLH
ncbi:hypothetical protein C4K14_4109 [Pseudomonas chlororaphis subsp. aureofaciens]|nr:hypothetical protein C4K14_4109 [Pseudomonas chlororaphis subsp. aureofaciens]